MNALITPIVKLSKKFFDSPIECNKYFAITNDYQKYCYNSNLLTRCAIGVVAKEAMLVHDIFFNLIAGSIKLLTGGIKGLCAIPAGAFNTEIGHQRSVKESVVHFGFSAFYTADMILSFANINNSYPKDLFKKIEGIFAKFLQIPNRKAIEEELRKTNEELARAVQDLEDISQLIDHAEKILKQPSNCEKVVNRVFHSNTKARLKEVGNIINSDRKREDPTFSKELQELIDQHTRDIPSLLPPHKMEEESWDFENSEESWNFEENLEPKNYVENIEAIERNIVTPQESKLATKPTPLIQEKTILKKPIRQQSQRQNPISSCKNPPSAQEKRQRVKAYEQSRREKFQRGKKPITK